MDIQKKIEEIDVELLRLDAEIASRQTQLAELKKARKAYGKVWDAAKAIIAEFPESAKTA